MENERCQSKEMKFVGNKECNVKDDNSRNASAVTKQTSISTLNTLIFWNISKAIEKNPNIDLKFAIKAAQMRLERESHGVNTMMTDDPEERHLGCALLAWQQLGNQDAESLYQFIEAKRRETNILENNAYKHLKPINACSKVDDYPLSSSRASKPDEVTTERSYLSTSNDFTSFDSYSMIGPVVKLPVESKIIMRLENTCKSCNAKNKETKSQTNPQNDKSQSEEKNIMDKIDAACCIDSACVERLQALDASIAELRVRAGRLARREAERAELLERAEAAWKDLDLGYQRRLSLATEKEDDMSKQIQKMIEERNNFKDMSTKLAQTLKEKTTQAEADRARLVEVEKELCQKACRRQKLTEDCARIDATIAEYQCKAVQLERDLQFKEEQARRRLASMKGEVEAARALTHEVERALRTELGALREQLEQVSNDLFEEDAFNGDIQMELERLQQQKNGMEEDLDACKVMCDGRIQDKLDELKKKREQITELREKVTECRCKMPVDENVQVKRTPSLAALCRCPPDEAIPESCSCTSLRSRLLSNLLSDLFNGLQGNLGETETQMPCQLLKCLDDKHNWDRSSEIKTNLRNYFSQLLMGELDIAITTSIENYHAKWIGASCADTNQDVSSGGRDASRAGAESWQEREYECRAQKLVTQFAEQLFQDKTQLQTHRTNNQIINSRNLHSRKRPLCECCQPESAVYQCLVKAPKLTNGITKNNNTTASKCWQRTIKDVIDLKERLEDLKKETVKKEDLKEMENNITKIVQQVSGPADINKVSDVKHITHVEDHSEQRDKKLLYKSQTTKVCINNNKRSNNITKKQNSKGHLNKGNKNHHNEPIVESRIMKKIGQSIAVNLCLCSPENSSIKQKRQVNSTGVHNKQEKPLVNNDTNLYNKQHIAQEEDISLDWNQNPLKLVLSHVSNIRQTKPISQMVSSGDDFDKAKTSTQKCVCFHKTPSTTSIDNFIDNLINLKVIENSQQQNKKTTTDIKTVAENINCKISKEISTNNDEEIGTMTSLCNLTQKVAKYSGEPPETTESEYIAAINLDKSFENQCNSKHNIEQPKDSCHSNTTFMCEHSVLSSHNESADSNNEQLVSYNILDKKNLKSRSLQCDIKRTVMSSLSPYDCDYNINFLGVTLTNLNLKQRSENDYDTSKRSFSNSPNAKRENNKIMNSDKMCDTQNTINIHNLTPYYVSPILSSNKKTFQTINVDKPLDTPNTRDYDDFSPRVHNPLNISKERNEKVNTNKLLHDIDYDDLPSRECSPKLSSNKEVDNTMFLDKELDHKNFTPSLIKIKESCVCCKRPSKDETKQLEINARQLLKEHLKGKLMEIKTFGESCIQDEIQNKILSDIFQKTNQVISDNLNVVACKCSEEDQIEGSWRRAYSLLQEYLKVKIKRVQCKCTSNKDTTNTVLPNILDKVCSLINKDFQRVEALYKQNNDFNLKEMNDEQLEAKKILDNDTNITSKHVRMSVGTENIIGGNKIEGNSYKPLFVCQNVSLQVPSYLKLESKSCDAMPIGMQCTQTEVTCKKCNKSNSMTSVGNSRCTNVKDCNSNKILPYKGNTIDCKGNACIRMKSVIERQPVEIDNVWKDLSNQKNGFKNMSFIMGKVNSVSIEHIPPYIGHTINCTCDGNIGDCICMKSVVDANPARIENIWKEFTGRQITRGNVSYIMSRVNKEQENFNCLENTINKNNICKTDVADYIKKNIREAQVSVNNDGEEIFLKKSVTNIVKAHNSTNTSDNEEAVGLNTDDALEWYGSGLQYNQFTSRSNLSNDYDSTFLTGANVPKILAQKCNCSMVPICHVKMLIESIEKKLKRSKCTCDWLNSNVCPIHSKRSFYL